MRTDDPRNAFGEGEDRNAGVLLTIPDRCVPSWGVRICGLAPWSCCVKFGVLLECPDSQRL
jgi:hypothetical protein